MTRFKHRGRYLDVANPANVPLLLELVALFDAASVAPSAAASSSHHGSHSKMQVAYGKAILSIAKYPLEIASAEEAEELQGIGSFLAARIGRILKEKLNRNDNSITAAAASSSSPQTTPTSTIAAPSTTSSKEKAAKETKAKKPRKVATESKEDPSAMPSFAASSSIPILPAFPTAAAAALPTRAVLSAASASSSSSSSSLIPILSSMPSIFSPDTLAAYGRTHSSPQPASSKYSASSSNCIPLVSQLDCPYGAECYRTNPVHYQEMLHPSSHPLAALFNHASMSPRKSAATSSSSNGLTPQKRSHDVIVLSDADEEDENEPGQPELKKAKLAASAHSNLASVAAEDAATTIAAANSSTAALYASAAARHRKQQAAASSTDAKPSAHKFRRGDDFLSDNDEEEEEDVSMEDVVDLTSPPITSIRRTLSSPPAPTRRTIPAAAAAAASSTPASSAVPPLHPSTLTASLLLLPASAATTKKVAKSEKQYKPKLGGSAYALLRALLSQVHQPLTKSHIVQLALPYFTSDKQDEAEIQSAVWNGMATLITKDLVNKSLTPILYSLTPLGMSTIKEMLPKPSLQLQLSSSPDDFLTTPSPAPTSTPQLKLKLASPIPTAGTLPSSNSPLLSAAAASSHPATSFAPLVRRFCGGGDFELVLLIDVRERSGRKDAAYMIEKLGKHGLVCESRALSVGDFMWIARHKVQRTIEVVLDAIIERKRVSDLVSSIRDGRYHEQRSRLKKTKLQRMIYVIEGRVADDTVHGLPLKTVETVLTSMNGVHNMLVHHTPAIEPTISFLESIHHLLQSEILATGVPMILHEDTVFQPLPPQLVLPTLTDSSTLCGGGESFTSFTSRLSKSANLLTAELFGTQLRMIRGISAALAMNIIARYPSARALLEAYQRCENQQAEEEMLAEIPRGPFQRSMGSAMSQKIRAFFRSEDY